MPLSRADLDSVTWLHVKADVQARLGDLLLQLTSTQLAHDATQALRGRIAECNRLLALEAAPEVVPRRGSIAIPREASSSDDDPL